MSLTFLCLLAVGPKVQAVFPPPDGGYPRFNTAEGQNALLNLITGSANTAVGWYSLFADGNIFGASVNGGTAMPVSVDADGKFGTVANLGAALQGRH